VVFALDGLRVARVADPAVRVGLEFDVGVDHPEPVLQLQHLPPVDRRPA